MEESLKNFKNNDTQRPIKSLRQEKIELFKMQLEITLSEYSSEEKPTKKELAKKMGVSERQFYRLTSKVVK